MPFCTKDYHPAASHPCLYPRLMPGTKRKREPDGHTPSFCRYWYLAHKFSGPPPPAKVHRPGKDEGQAEPAGFSSLLIRHVADLARKPKPQRKAVRFLTAAADTTTVDSEQDVAVTTATYFRTKAPTAAWIRGQGPSQVDNPGMGMTTYGEGGQLRGGKKSLFLASGGGEVVELEKAVSEEVKNALLGELWLSEEYFGKEWQRSSDGGKWCNREDDFPWVKVE